MEIHNVSINVLLTSAQARASIAVVVRQSKNNTYLSSQKKTGGVANFMKELGYKHLRRMRHFGIILGSFLLTCCNSRERSEIEIVKYDEELVKQIQSDYDSSYTEYPKRADYWTVDNYLADSAKSAMILKDYYGNIVGIVMIENGTYVFSQEYYANGQAMGKEVNGFWTYYYEDGRISATGKRDDIKQVGIWKEYDKDGYLTLIQYYNNEGSLEREDKFE